MGKTLGYGEITVANVTEPFTVMLTNEAQQFATDSNRKVTSAQSYYTDIIVIRGSQERTDYTIGNITSGSGITVSKNSKRVTFSVSAGTTIGADAGVIEIPITLDGQTVKKQFSWSCGKQGPQGVKGQDGNSFAWNMLSETNCGKKHWGTESSGGKYSVEDFITEDNIDAVKLICTEAISTSNWSYVSFKDIKMLKQLKPSTKYTLSYDIKANRSGAISHSICKGDVSNFCTNTVVVNNIIGNETWQHISVVLTTNDLKTTPTNEILYLGRNALSKVGYSIIKNLKLVEGDIDTPWSPSQSDIEGKGVVETVQYYLATSQASGVTSSTSGWSTDITTQKLTADKKYLWNCYQTKYSDGTSEPISTPKVIGVYGDKGQNAKNLSITPSSQYFKSTDGGKTFAPNTITIKPTIQGEISFGKWQYSIDGGISFADVVSEQKGLTVSNNVLTVSKDSSLYSDAVTMVTFRAVASDSSFYDTCSIAKIYDVSDIGDGRNLWITRDNITLQACEKDKYIYTTTGTSAVCIGATGSSVGTNTIALQTGTKYTISFVISSPSEVGNTQWYFCTALNSTGVKNYGGYGVKLVTGENIVSQTITVDTSCDTAGLVLYNLPTGCVIKDIQVEKGSSPTGWTPAPEDVQTAILSTKSEIADVSLKVDKNKQAIEQRVEKTTYQQDLNLVKGDISKANEGLNKWRYEIYPKSLFTSEYQGKSTMDVFAKNTNLTPSQSVLINDTDLSIAWNYAENYIGYALTFAKFSAAKSVAITFAHDDGAHIYLNGKLIGGSDAYNKNGESLTLGFVKGWNCIEVVVNEGANTEGFKLGTTISAISECQLMNCYYGTPVARQSHITNQLVQNTTDIDGISGSVQTVMSTVGGSDKIDEFVSNYSTWKKKVNGIETRVGETYTTKSDFNGLEIGGRNLIIGSSKAEINSNWKQNGWAGSFTTYSAEERIYKLVASNGWHVARYTGLTEYAGQIITISFKAKNVKAETTASDGYDLFITNETGANPYTSSSLTSAKPTQDTWVAYKASMLLNSDGQIGIGTRCNPEGKGYKATWLIKDLKVEKGNKPTDWTPAQEDDEINGQNLVSNLPSNWEQGTVTEGSAIGTTYANTKSSSAGSIRPKELIPVSGDITISIAYSNQSKKPIRHWIAAYDVNKNYLGNNYVSNAWNSFPRTLDMKDAKYIAIMVGYTDSSAITPSDISQICLKIECGTSATPFTLAQEDINGKIVNVETIANQTAKKFEWIVKGGDKSSSMVLTDDFLNIVANKINLKGKVTFESLSSDAKSDILNSFEVGGINLISDTRDMKSWAKGGKLTITYDQLDIKNNINAIKVINSESTAGNAYLEPPNRGPLSSGKYTVSFYAKTDSSSGAYVSVFLTNEYSKTFTINNIWTQYIITFDVTNDIPVTNNFFWFNFAGTTDAIYFCYAKLEKGNKATDWSPAPEDYLPQANLVSNWTTNTTWIDGGKIYTGSITADKIAANSITADKIATDAIKSRNYISSGGTQGSFLNLSDGSFQSPNLSWDSNGNLIAKNANLSGEITATNGSIGKYKITDQWLITGSGSTATGIGGNQAFWAGAEDSNSAPFRVGYDGKLYANGATISGDITATTGKIGDLTLKDGILTGTGSYSEPYTEDDDGTVTSTITTNYITKLFGKGLTIDSTVKYSDEDDVYSYKVSVLPDEISFTDGEEIGMLGAGGLQILQVNDNSDSYSSEANEVSLSSGASNFYYTTPVNQTTDKYLHVCFSADGASFMASQGDKFNSFDIGYSSAKYSGNFAANKFVYTGNSLNYVECLEANDTTNVYFHSSGYYSFRVNNEGNWSNETQSVYITERGISVPGKIGLYSQEMSNYVARYYVAGSTKSTAIGNNSYQTRIYGSSVWANKAVSTSDVRLKQDFQSLDKFEDLYMQLQPVSFKYIDGYDKSEDRYFGLKAQPTEQLFEDMGENPDDYAMFNKFGIDHEDIKERIGYDVDFDEEHGLDYTNLITLNTHMVQKTRRELAELQKENAELKDMLKTIVEKINM